VGNHKEKKLTHTTRFNKTAITPTKPHLQKQFTVFTAECFPQNLAIYAAFESRVQLAQNIHVIGVENDDLTHALRNAIKGIQNIAKREH
jgi:hypothetical protein